MHNMSCSAYAWAILCHDAKPSIAETILSQVPSTATQSAANKETGAAGGGSGSVVALRCS